MIGSRSFIEVDIIGVRLLVKIFFSGGILSSQRVESTNRSISCRLQATTDLCEFYNNFLDVVAEWRSKENGKDYDCWDGRPETCFAHVHLLIHATEVYTAEAYHIFQQEYKKGVSCAQAKIQETASCLTYRVWREQVDEFFHIVNINWVNETASCTCKKFEEMGILCFHILRIFNMYCVKKIPEKYILDRWRKNIKAWGGDNNARCFSKSTGTSSSVWRLQALRKFSTLIIASATNEKTRAFWDELFGKAKDALEKDIGPIYHCGSEEENVNSRGIVQNPNKTREKGQRNKRKVSIAKKMSNQVKARKKNASKQATNSISPLNISPNIPAAE